MSNIVVDVVEPSDLEISEWKEATRTYVEGLESAFAAARAECEALRKTIDNAEKIHGVLEILGTLYRDLREGESAADWAKRVIKEREELRKRLASLEGVINEAGISAEAKLRSLRAKGYVCRKAVDAFPSTEVPLECGDVCNARHVLGTATCGCGWSGGHHCKLVKGHDGPHVCAYDGCG